MKIACVSDCHGVLDQAVIPDADILIIAGDYCPNWIRGSGDAVRQDVWASENFIPFLKTLKFERIIIVAGNHDWLHLSHTIAWPENVVYLQDESYTYNDLHFYGSPWQPWFYDWAFNFSEYDSQNGYAQAIRTWSKIPNDVDVLITHSPPKGILDLCPDGRKVGCPILRERVLELKPMLHVFGHIHNSYGQRQGTDTMFINAALCDEDYNPTQEIQIWTLNSKN